MQSAPTGDFEQLLRAGAKDASDALARWLDRPASIVIKHCERLPLERAAGALGDGTATVCAAAMSVSGGLGGVLLVACEEQAGLALCDALLGRPVGSSVGWDEVERSGILETANIVGCSYLNGVAAAVNGATRVIVPSPPVFLLDYAAALMDGLLLERAGSHDTVLLARTEFQVVDTPIRCALVYVPDAESLRDIETAPNAVARTP